MIEGAIPCFIEFNMAGYYYKSHSHADTDCTEEIVKNKDRIWAVKEMNITVKKGEFLMIIGRNGSGKSTFAKLMNALLKPDTGFVVINGMLTSDENNLFEIRKTAGMVFQNPDNQIVGTTVEEDVAFGLENIGISPSVMPEKVKEALSSVGLLSYMKHSPHLLSGGQKQRVAIAGILAMKPECIILDESTSMLDPEGRQELMAVLEKLNKEEGITVIHITHNMDEVKWADRVAVINEGKLIMEGHPGEVFKNTSAIRGIGLDLPYVSSIFEGLRRNGVDLPVGIIDEDTAIEALKNWLSE